MVRLWFQRVWLGCLLLMATAGVMGQVPTFCRTTEITQELFRHYGITEEKIRAVFEAASRQAGREAPALFYSGWGSSLYPPQGLIGTLRALHVLVRPNSPDIFPDPQHTAEFYRRFLFDETNPDSLASYLKEASYGRLRLLGDSYGPIPINVPVTTTGAITHISNFVSILTLQRIISQVITALDSQVDFSRYDSDRDGRLDLLFLTIACDPDARPPAGNFTLDPTYGAFTLMHGRTRRIDPTIPPLAVTEEGIRVECAVFVHEVHSIITPNMGGCGVYAHEFGHVFGLPDLYNPADPSQVDPGAWSLMATGAVFFPGRVTLNPLRPSGHPGHFDPWCKMMLGWLSPVEVTRDAGLVSLPALPEQPTAYRLWAFGNPISDEYFLVVNRQLRGFDRLLPGFGLNIFHVDRSILNDPVRYFANRVQFDRLRKGVDLVDADDRNDMDYAVIQTQAFDWTNFGFLRFAQGNWGDDSDPFPGGTNNTRFEFLSRPSSVSYIGLDSGVRVLDIRPQPDGTIQATLRVAYAPQATVLAPRSGEIVYTRRPTLQVLFSAPLGAFADIDPASIQVQLNGAPVPITNPSAVFNEATQTLSLELPDLPSGTHTIEVQASNRVGITVRAETTFSVLPLRFSPMQDRAGRILPFMITLPYDFQHPSVPPERRHPEFVFGIPRTQRFIARWGVVNAAGQQDYLFSGEFVEQLAPGRAYWVRLRQDTFLAIDAPDVDRSKPFRIANEPIWDRTALDVGWQQIGNPYPFPVNASAVQVMLPSGQVLSLAESVQQEVILGTVYHYTVVDGVPTYVALRVSDWSLAPFTGYWIYKRKPCSFVIIPAPDARGRSLPTPSPRSLVSLEIWGERAEIPYRVAVTDKTEEIPAPPTAPGTTAWAGFIPVQNPSRSSALPLMEVPATKAGRWLLTVRSAAPHQQVTLRWRSEKGMPVRITVTDTQTARSFVLQGAGEWTMTTDERGHRTLIVTVGADKGLPLRFLDVKISRTRGNQFWISGRLTTPARVRAEVLTLTGRLVQVLPELEATTTQWQFFWDGRGASGQRVSTGAYLLRLSARDQLGRETQRVVVLR